MSERIAEFLESDDARRFAKMKGDDYTVCGGIHLPYAVMPKILYAGNFGQDEPPDLFHYDDDPKEDEQEHLHGT